MSDKTEYCYWTWRHMDRKLLATHILRISCPRHPETCALYKIVTICEKCVERIEKRIATRSEMSCSECSWRGKPSDFWHILGRL